MTDILVIGLFLFLVSQIVHIVIWRIFSPKAYPIWLPVIFTLTPVVLFLILHLLVIIGILNLRLDRHIYLILVNSLVMHLALSAMYVHMYPGIVFFSLSFEIIKLLAENEEHGLPVKMIDLPVFSEANTIDMRIKHLSESGMVEEREGYLALTRKGRSVARGIFIFRLILGLPGIGKG